MSNEHVFTIGHSNHTLERFMHLLESAGITAVADVRSSPFSRYNPQFNRDVLETALKGRGMAYVFLGGELGARSDDPSCYADGRVQYGRLALTDPFRDGLQRVRKGARKYRLTLMCAEKDPLECHRTILVARALDAQGVSVSHILADGSREEHAAAMTRLLSLVGLPQADLLRSRDQLVEAACALQEERIAFRESEPSQPVAQAQR